MKEFLECGIIGGAHGIKGACRVESLCDSPGVLCSLHTVYLQKNNESYVPLEVLSASVYKGMGLMIFRGYETPESVIVLRGKTLFAARTDIPVPKGTVLLADLFGLAVYDEQTGEKYGTLTDIDTAHAQTIYTVTTPNGHEVLLPAVPEFIRKVKVGQGVFIRPIPGFFDEV